MSRQEWAELPWWEQRLLLEGLMREGKLDQSNGAAMAPGFMEARGVGLDVFAASGAQVLRL